MKRILVTGWAGFIGSNMIRFLREKAPDSDIFGIDAMTYAARPEWALQDSKIDSRFHDLGQINIAHGEFVRKVMRDIRPDAIIHFAAESHVCRSIYGPRDFVETNVVGTFNLLEAAKHHVPNAVFHHVSTDEVYGEAPEDGYFTELSQYAPRSPYSASKAASDQLVMAWHHTYGLNTRITNCSNNFGPNQHEEKLIPKTIISILEGKPVTLYGPGTQVRDWIWVMDHCEGIWRTMKFGKAGSQYLLGGKIQIMNSTMVQAVIQAMKEVALKDCWIFRDPEIISTNERPTDDKRYAIDCSKAWRELDWSPNKYEFSKRLQETIRWYKERHHLQETIRWHKARHQ